MERVKKLVSENGVVVFSKSTCCLCYVLEVLFNDLGVQHRVHQIDQDPEGKEIEKALLRLGGNAAVPVVFVGGDRVGSTNEVMSLHLSGMLIPLLNTVQPLRTN